MTELTPTRERLVIASEHRGALADLVARCVPRGSTAEQAAKACHELLRQVAEAGGQDPDQEVFIRAPGEPRHYDDLACWCVCWEAGPYDWAIPASIELTARTRKVVEPWYGFDLSFYPGEWA